MTFIDFIFFMFKYHLLEFIIAMVIFLIAIIMIVSGIYLFYINSPQKLFSNLVDKAIIYLENNESKENITGISKNYTLKSNIKFNLESKILENSTDIEDLEIKNLLKNLNNTTNDIVFTQDTTNKKMYISINSLLNNKFWTLIHFSPSITP